MTYLFDPATLNYHFSDGQVVSEILVKKGGDYLRKEYFHDYGVFSVKQIVNHIEPAQPSDRSSN